MVFVLIRAVPTVAFFLDKMFDTVGCCVNLLAQKLTSGADHFHARVHTVEIQREHVGVLVVEANRLPGLRGTDGEEEVGSSCQKVIVHRKAPLTALRTANNHIKGRSEVISANNQYLHGCIELP